MSEYKGLDIVRDAVAFSKSKFGQHYLSRLEKARKRALDDAENLEFTDSYRANRASQANAHQKQIDYFEIAKTISEDPSAMRRLIDKMKRKDRKEEPDIEL